MKRIVCIFLAIIMIFGMIPVSAAKLEQGTFIFKSSGSYNSPENYSLGFGAFGGSGLGEIEFGFSATEDIPSTWSASSSFSLTDGLVRGETYYFFARKLGDATYNEIVSDSIMCTIPPASERPISSGGGGGGFPFVAFSFQALNPVCKGVIIDAVYDDEEINMISPAELSITVPIGTDLTNLVASFATSHEITKVNDIVQISGITPNDFSEPVEYSFYYIDENDEEELSTTYILEVAVESPKLQQGAIIHRLSGSYNSMTNFSVTFRAIGGSGLGAMEYGVSSTETVPTVWQSSATFTQDVLVRETTYYFFARKLGDDIYSEIISGPISYTTPEASDRPNTGGGGGGTTKPKNENEEEQTEADEEKIALPITVEPDYIFVDVDSRDWFNNDVNYVISHGLFKGVSDTEFGPRLTMTRAMIITVLARYAEIDTSGGAEWYSKALEWGIANGITDGSDLNENVTREQLAVLMWRYAEQPSGYGDLSGFADNGMVSVWAVDALIWANGAGLINGYPDGTMNPQGNATRAEVAAIMRRFVELTK